MATLLLFNKMRKKMEVDRERCCNTNLSTVEPTAVAVLKLSTYIDILAFFHKYSAFPTNIGFLATAPTFTRMPDNEGLSQQCTFANEKCD